ncbi:MAG TPA: FtsX-like permease family protein [Solirubrobacteraceae bacterium]|nr:FtsX-like permease family protein [Solirubrobacteraceae bacterium]
MLSLGEILFLYRARLRERVVVVQELLAVVGIAVGVALLFASQVASTSLDGSVRQITQQIFAGTQYQLDARGSEGFPVQIVDRVQRLPGVLAALPLLEQQATITGPSGQASVDLIGADPRFVHAGGPLLKRFKASQLEHQHAIALPAPVAASIGVGPLQPVNLQLGANVVESLVGATLQEGDVGALVHSQVALAPISYAQQLTRLQGRVTRVFVQAQPGRTATVQEGLRKLAAANDLNLEPADFDATLFRVASGPAQQSEGLFSVISAVVGFMFAFNAMLLTVPERRRLIEDIRRRGATRLMTVQALAFDALVLGVLACVLGLLFGEWLSVKVFHSQSGYLSFAFPVGSQREVTWLTVVEAAGAGILAAFVGVLAPVRDILARPLRSRDAIERTPRGWNGFRIVVGALCMTVTTLILVFRPQWAALGSFTLIVALLATLPFLFNWIVAGFDRVQRLFHGASTVLAVAELEDPLTRVRSLAIAATGALAVFGSVAITGAQHNLQKGLDRTAYEWNKTAALWVSPSGINNTLGTTAFPGSAVSKLNRLPGVRGVRVYRGSFLNVGERRTWVIAPSRASSQPVPPGQLISGDVAEVNARLRGDGWAVLSDAIARERHLHIGDSFTLPSPRPTTLRVAGLSTNAGWPPGAIVINAEDYARAWGSQASSALNIDLAPGVSAAGVRTQVIHALGPNSGLAVQTSGEREQQWKSITRQGLARLTQIATLVLVAAILAMAGVMASMIWQRRDRIAYIKRQGFTRGLMWRALFFESAVLLIAGCSIGAVFGLYGQLLLSHALTTVTGFPLVVGVGPLIALTSVAIVSTAALAIVAVPGYLAARARATMVKPA